VAIRIAEIQAHTAVVPRLAFEDRDLMTVEPALPILKRIGRYGKRDVNLTRGVVWRVGQFGRSALLEQQQEMPVCNIECYETLPAYDFGEAEQSRIEMEGSIEILDVQRCLDDAGDRNIPTSRISRPTPKQIACSGNP
jgi:hypothetical protein